MSELTVIAEIGLNASGKISDAKKLIDMAKECGCDAVKFQKRTIDSVYKRDFLDSPRTSPFGSTQRHQKEAIEFGQKQYDEIDKHCKEKHILWGASAWDMDSLVFLKQYNCLFNKVASAMITNKAFVEAVAKEHRQTYISTGGSTMNEIRWAVEMFNSEKTPFTLMHCTSIYPCPDSSLNLCTINLLQRKFSCPVGFSSHSQGILAPALAVALGAEVIEVHVSLDRGSYGSDQSASLERDGLQRVIRDCKIVHHKALGSGEKVVLPEEIMNLNKLRYWRV